MRDRLLAILMQEVKPALGCTEPIAVALAGAKARELLGEEPVSAKIITSSNVYKNGMCVGIPGTGRIGLDTAAALGIMGGDANRSLQVLSALTPETAKAGEDFQDSGAVDVSYQFGTDGVYINCVLQGATSQAEVTIQGRHDQMIFLRKNDEILLETPVETAATAVNPHQGVTLRTIYDACITYTQEELAFLWDGVEMNRAMAQYGMDNAVGAQVGHSIKLAIEAGDMADDFHSNAIMWTASASDARMSGVNLPVMSSSSSGNHGLTAILPIAVYAQRNQDLPRIKVLRALAMSHLLTSYIKSYTGRLSAVCGCGVAASTGTSFGLAYLMGLEYAYMERSVDLMIASVSGMICDGAKAGCAAKLAVATATAIECCIMAKGFAKLPQFNGIVGFSVDESIRNLGAVTSQGMVETDRVILSVMDNMNHQAK